MNDTELITTALDRIQANLRDHGTLNNWFLTRIMRHNQSGTIRLFFHTERFNHVIQIGKDNFLMGVDIHTSDYGWSNVDYPIDETWKTRLIPYDYDYCWQGDTNDYPFDIQVMEPVKLSSVVCAICQQETDTPHTANNAQVCPTCYDSIQAYAYRVNARYERLQRVAERAQETSDALWQRSHDMASIIPLGQPILVGHHSEGWDRRYRERIHQIGQRAYEHHKKAQYYAQRADAAEHNRAISSDDPAAVLKLRQKLAKLEELQTEMKRINVEVRKVVKMALSQDEKIAKLAEIARISLVTANKALQPDFMGRIGIPDYMLKNNNAEIRRLKARIDELTTKRQTADEKGNEEQTVGNIRVEKNREENRLRLYFPGKPDRKVIEALKSRGFRWSPSNMAWQRMLTSGAEYDADYIVKLAQ